MTKTVPYKPTFSMGVARATQLREQTLEVKVCSTNLTKKLNWTRTKTSKRKRTGSARVILLLLNRRARLLNCQRISNSTTLRETPGIVHSVYA